MKNYLRFLPVFVALTLAGISCHPSLKMNSLGYSTYRINDSLDQDPASLALLSSYSRTVDSLMNGVIGYVEKNLDKQLPEGGLGNFMADAYFIMAKEKYHMPVDAAFMNHGGIRLNQLPAGAVTTGRIYELMPFDNLLILQKVKGTVLQSFLDLLAGHGGWPVAGLTMKIKTVPGDNGGKKAVDVLIGGKPLDPEHIYTIVNSDYVANGGGDAFMLKNIPQISNGYLMRNALFDYIKWLKDQGKNISASIENRVTNAE